MRALEALTELAAYARRRAEEKAKEGPQPFGPETIDLLEQIIREPLWRLKRQEEE